jgi:hypothetical protein
MNDKLQRVRLFKITISPATDKRGTKICIYDTVHKRAKFVALDHSSSDDIFTQAITYLQTKASTPIPIIAQVLNLNYLVTTDLTTKITG